MGGKVRGTMIAGVYEKPVTCDGALLNNKSGLAEAKSLHYLESEYVRS